MLPDVYLGWAAEWRKNMGGLQPGGVHKLVAKLKAECLPRVELPLHAKPPCPRRRSRWHAAAGGDCRPARGHPGEDPDLDARGGAIVDAVRPVGDEQVLHKPLPNAFAQTDLDATLKTLGRQQVVFAGFMTHMCVSATIRSALDHGYHVTVASDAVATRDLPDPLGGPDLSAEQINRAALAELADRFAAVAAVRDIKAR